MEYVYAALLLHSAGKEITDEAITAVIEAAGLEVDTVRAKALVSALEGINIEEAISKAAVTAPAAAPAKEEAAAPAEGEAEAPKKEEKEKEKEEEKSEESGMEGLGALFG